MTNIPCVYLFIYRIFKTKAEGRIFISHAAIREVLRRRLHKIPRVLHYEILREMEQLGLIKRKGNTKNIAYEDIKKMEIKNIDKILQESLKDTVYELLGKDIDKLLNQFNLPL